jgi:acyl carrier protein
VAPEAIRRDSARQEFPTWDSLGHLNLMLALEDTFEITLSVEEIACLISVGAILDHLRTLDGQ